MDINHHNSHPSLRQKLTFGQKVADKVAAFGGSWAFIIFFITFIVAWIITNTVILMRPYDVYPFILLNLGLSMLAALQAPVILMAQNRQTERDRINSRYDYIINRKAEREIQAIRNQLQEIQKSLRKI